MVTWVVTSYHGTYGTIRQDIELEGYKRDEDQEEEDSFKHQSISIAFYQVILAC